MSRPLSPEMLRAVEIARTLGGGKLVRYPGGFWAQPELS